MILFAVILVATGLVGVSAVMTSSAVIPDPVTESRLAAVQRRFIADDRPSFMTVGRLERDVAEALRLGS
jgi:hypothetical protein